MNSEIKQAFAHPEMRSAATNGDPILDRLSLRDHIIEVEIGAFQSERGITQRISFNVVVEVQPSKGAHTDDVDDILSYDSVTEAIAFEIAAERLNLLETLAERVAARILLEPQAERVFVRIEKLDRGAGALGVEIIRSHEETSQAAEITDLVAPQVIHFPTGATGSSFLTTWVDQIVALERPVIITVEGSDAGNDGEDQIAQRRIKLLSIEQNAWRLAASDHRCVVVGSWTELDWGVKNGQLSVWAPSKTVLDCPDKDLGTVTDPVELSKWLSRELGAEDFVVLDPTSQTLTWQVEK